MFRHVHMLYEHERNKDMRVMPNLLFAYICKPMIIRSRNLQVAIH